MSLGRLPSLPESLRRSGQGTSPNGLLPKQSTNGLLPKQLPLGLLTSSIDTWLDQVRLRALARQRRTARLTWPRVVQQRWRLTFLRRAIACRTFALGVVSPSMLMP